MKINFELRKLLQDREVNILVKDIYDIYKVKTTSFSFRPKLTNRLLNEFFEAVYASSDDDDPIRKDYDTRYNNCFKNKETRFLDILKDIKIIAPKYHLSEDGDEFNCELEVKDRKSFLDVVRWVFDEKSIINYGLFSLNTLTGESYYIDKQVFFVPGSGHFNLFKEFMVTTKNSLDFSEIVKIQQGKLVSELDEEWTKMHAKNCIKYLKNKFGIGQELLLMHQRSGYKLRPEIIA